MGMKRKKRAPRRRGWLLGSSATQVICISFVLLIALGTLLLTLPISSRSGRLGVVDAMFTATSATCVTGLVVRDTWTQFTPFGQAVVLLLIQVGGLGLAPGVNMSDSLAFYEATHGTAPTIAGQDKANPLATILSAGMMLRLAFGLSEEADAVENAVRQTLRDGFRTGDIMEDGCTLVGCAEMGRLVAERL